MKDNRNENTLGLVEHNITDPDFNSNEIIVGGGDIKKNQIQIVRELFDVLNYYSLHTIKIILTYLSRIDSENPSNTVVYITKEELAKKFYGVERIRDEVLQERLYALSSVVFKLPSFTKDVKTVNTTLFAVGDNDVWVRLKCQQDAMPYFFELKKKGYLSISAAVIPKLTSKRQLNMYEYLGINRYRKKWTIKFVELRDVVLYDKVEETTEDDANSKKSSYTTYKNYNKLVLKKLQKFFKEEFGIVYEYSCLNIQEKDERKIISFKIINWNEQKIIEKAEESDIKVSIKFSQAEMNDYLDLLEPLEIAQTDVVLIGNKIYEMQEIDLGSDVRIPETSQNIWSKDTLFLRRHYFLEDIVKEIYKKNKKRPIKDKGKAVLRAIESKRKKPLEFDPKENIKLTMEKKE